MIKWNVNRFFHFRIGSGNGINTKAELIVVWALMTLAVIYNTKIFKLWESLNAS